MPRRTRLGQAPDHGPRPAEEPPRDALDRRDPVGHRRVARREDRDGDPACRAAQDRGLVDEPAAPAALEQHVEHGPPGAGDPPALLGDNRAQQAVGEDAVARGQHVVEAVEEPRLVGRGHTRVEQGTGEGEAPHPGRATHRPQAGVADDGVDRGRGRVVRAADHRREPRAGGAVDRRVRPQVGDEEQRLDEARRRRAPRRAPPVQVAPGVADSERHVAAAPGGEARRGDEPGGARRDGLGHRGLRLRRRGRRQGRGEGEDGDGHGEVARGHASRSWAAG